MGMDLSDHLCTALEDGELDVDCVNCITTWANGKVYKATITLQEVEE